MGVENANKQEMVSGTDAEMARNNRLTLLMETHKQWQAKKGLKECEKNKRCRIMGKKTTEAVICEQCGEEKNSLRNDRGKQVCSSCQVMRGLVRNNPRAVVAAVREYHGDKYFSGKDGESVSDEHFALLSKIWSVINLDGLVDPERAADLDQYILGMSMALDKQNARVEKARVEIAKIVDALEIQIDYGKSWADTALEMISRNTAALERSLELNREDDALWEKLRDAYGASKTESKYDLLYAAVCVEESYRQKDKELEALRFAGCSNDSASYDLGRVCEALGLDIDTDVNFVLRKIEQLQKNNAALDEAVVFGGAIECTLDDAVDQGVQYNTMLDLALAALRGDGNMMADCLEMMRSNGEV